MKMVKFIFAAIITLLTTQAMAQGKDLPSAILVPFHSIRIEADMDVKLVAIGEDEGPKMVYDLSDNDPEKFKFSVKKDGTLEVNQNYNSKSVSPIRATIYYNKLKSLKVYRARVTFDTPFAATMADISLNDEATLSGDVQCDDLHIELAAESRIDIEGVSKYLTLNATSASKAELRKLDVTSANISTSQGAVVAIISGERLELSASTNSVIKYWGKPKILRSRQGLLGGQLVEQKIDK